MQPELEISNKQKIIGTRNKLAHEYDEVDPTILFLIVTKYLPLLKAEIENILQRNT